MKLNLGCGNDIREGYVNVDVLEDEGVIKSDIIDYLVDQPANVAEEVVLKDVVEHFPHGLVEENGEIVHSDVQPGVFELLHLVKKVLMPNGTLYIRVPNFRWVVEKWIIWMRDGDKADEQMNFSRVNWTLCGEIRHSLKDGHHSLWTKEAMANVLKSVGFKVLSIKQCDPNFEVIATKTEK